MSLTAQELFEVGMTATLLAFKREISKRYATWHVYQEVRTAVLRQPPAAYLAAERWGDVPYFVKRESIRMWFKKQREAELVKQKTTSAKHSEKENTIAGNDIPNVRQSQS